MIRILSAWGWSVIGLSGLYVVILVTFWGIPIQLSKVLVVMKFGNTIHAQYDRLFEH